VLKGRVPHWRWRLCLPVSATKSASVRRTPRTAMLSTMLELFFNVGDAFLVFSDG
jgi:hypothetical protein